MSRQCKECKFLEYDYEWDDDAEDEIEIPYCSAGHKKRFKKKGDCKYFRKCETVEYHEEQTECDNCPYLRKCNDTMDITNLCDSFKHFAPSLSGCSKRELSALIVSEFAEKFKALAEM